ncbi:MAG: apolipoprotein N-acyltransferase [Elusimicrobiales bacterium]
MEETNPGRAIIKPGGGKWAKHVRWRGAEPEVRGVGAKISLPDAAKTGAPRHSPLWFAVCAAIFALTLAAAWLKPEWGFLAWLALAPFGLASLRAGGALRAAAFGWLAGFLFYLLGLYWIFPTCRAGALGIGQSLLAWVVLAEILALQWAAAAALTRKLARYGRLFPLLAAAAFTAVEYLAVCAGGQGGWFPWFLLGYTQWQNAQLIQIAAFAGVYGVGFIVAFFGFSLARWIGIITGGHVSARAAAVSFLRGMAAPAAVAAAVVVFGYFRLDMARQERRGWPEIVVAVIQPDIAQYKKWEPAFEDEILSREAALAALAAKAAPKLVIWPESALPGPMDEEKYSAFVRAIALATGGWQLIGTVRGAGGRDFVSAYAVSPEGAVAGIYDKRRLVPFGEFVPFRDILGRFAAPVNKLGEFSAGSADQRPLEVAGLSLNIGICYETIFPQLWRGWRAEQDIAVIPGALSARFAPLQKLLDRALENILLPFGFLPPESYVTRKNKSAFDGSGALSLAPQPVSPQAKPAAPRLLVSLTNDGWYLDTAAPRQHFAAAVLRAVESGIPLVRAANTGISGWIDGSGIVRGRTELNTPAAPVYRIAVSPSQSFYADFGDIFAGLCCVAAGCALLAAVLFL